MNIIGIDIAKGCDYTSVTFGNDSEIKATPNNKGVVRGLRRNLKLYDDYAWLPNDNYSFIKYLKRINNRNKLYNKLKRLGRRL
ncbi:hypothetical protein DVV91_10245 [Clostridium botulinum]|uniref:hypothetical protein n=1 Tax=Clostridium botulinum TaxID=1491 RepID=UPI00196884C4|nr:hypothetical protein [Clostridium botulinum]MBN1074722.1 hypothetical protein [Clostridium botulinum]